MNEKDEDPNIKWANAEKSSRQKKPESLLQKIIEYRVMVSPSLLSEELIIDCLNLHDSGKDDVMKMWVRLHEKDGYPPEALTKQGYFYILLDVGIITDYQYDLLMKYLKL